MTQRQRQQQRREWERMGAEVQLASIYEAFPDLRPAAPKAARSGARAAGSAPPADPAARPKRVLSAEGRANISRAQKRRWKVRRREERASGKKG